MAEQAMQESPVRALLVALSVALVCALVVSMAAVQLRPFYLANLEAERLARLDAILVSLRDSGGDIDFQDLEARVPQRLAKQQLGLFTNRCPERLRVAGIDEGRGDPEARVRERKQKLASARNLRRERNRILLKKGEPQANRAALRVELQEKKTEVSLAKSGSLSGTL